MKKFKQFLLPAVVAFVAVGAAFATNVAKSTQASMDGYYFDNSQNQCRNGNVQCSTDPGSVCTWTDPATSITHNLRQLDGTSCGDLLFKP